MDAYKKLHPHFKLNGKTFTEEELCEQAIDLIRDGEAYEKDLGNLILQWFDDNDFVELTTSGTTGVPKKVKLSKEAMRHSALATGEFFNLKSGDSALDRKSTRLNSSHVRISYAVFCLKKKT